MERITISLNADQEAFVTEKSAEYGNRSEVVRAAIDRMRKQEMIEHMRDHFRDESAESDEMKERRRQSMDELPDY